MPSASSRKKKDKAIKRTLSECHDCPAKCCHDLVLVVDKPKNKSDIAYYKWQLQYDTVRIAICDKKWHTVHAGRCMYLDDNNMCTIYEQRSKLCRTLNPPDCEHFQQWYDHMISTPEELDEYLEAEKARKRKKRQLKAKKKAEKKAEKTSKKT